MKDSLAEMISKWFPYVAVLILALWGGTSNYINRLKQSEGSKKFALAEWVGEMSISGFVGFLALLACLEYEVSIYMTGVIAGLAGHQGARFMFVIELMVKEWVKRKGGKL